MANTSRATTLQIIRYLASTVWREASVMARTISVVGFTAPTALAVISGRFDIPVLREFADILPSSAWLFLAIFAALTSLIIGIARRAHEFEMQSVPRIALRAPHGRPESSESDAILAEVYNDSNVTAENLDIRITRAFDVSGEIFVIDEYPQMQGRPRLAEKVLNPKSSATIILCVPYLDSNGELTLQFDNEILSDAESIILELELSARNSPSTKTFVEIKRGEDCRAVECNFLKEVPPAVRNHLNPSESSER